MASESSAAGPEKAPAPANQAEAFVAEHGLSLAAQAQDEDSKALMLESRYGPVYVESGATIPGTKATVTVQDKQTVKITVGQDSTTLKLGS
ncbi:hypothetical protein [Deinococcus proteolyticus]|uniref:hypothetical protein n=1 Tax=Deinococcus proteolyticus TaxID=55148 RepID=UPI00031BB1AA|nr:hypothetical protein [Deinococcus proteolyticus]